MDNKYEIEYQWFGDEFYFESKIATLTGLELEEIHAVTKNVKRWGGQTYIKIFRGFGFNTNTRFVKFDKETIYPCLMRTKKPGDKKYWYGFVYYDGNIYDQYYGKITWAEWNKCYPNYKITSMLQVWI